MTTFTTSRTYSTRSICDYDCIISLTVARRTAKTLTTTAGKTLRITTRDGVESVKPWGTYSMSPVIRAA
jgi:hypothetical protein